MAVNKGDQLMEKKALLINDSRFESLILKDMLQRLEYSVEIADEFEALYAINKYEPQLIIVNYIMQQTRGDKLIQLIKAGMPYLKCLLSSNSDIKISDFPGDYIDGIIHTPVSQYLLENVLGNVAQSSLDEKTNIHCTNCKRDLTEFLDITFCPFCGAPII